VNIYLRVLYFIFLHYTNSFPPLHIVNGYQVTLQHFIPHLILFFGVSAFILIIYTLISTLLSGIIAHSKHPYPEIILFMGIKSFYFTLYPSS